MEAEQIEARQAIAAARSETLRIRLLGPPLWTAGDRLSAFADPRACVLIAMVVLDGPLPRNQAADMFWPRSEGAARTNLRVLLHRLKHAIGAGLFASGDRLALLPDVLVDVAGTDTEIVECCLQLGASSLRLLHGVEFDDLPEVSAWLSSARHQMQQRVTRCLAVWLESRREHEDVMRAAAAAEALIALNPLSEVGYRALMRVLLERGDRAGALTAFERCRRELYEQLGTQPDLTTSALHRDILRMRSDAKSTLDAPPGRALLQREGELEEMARALESRRIVIVEGASGTGKTALLSHFARQHGDFYWAADPTDGQAPLAGLLRLAQHMEKVAAAVGSEGHARLAVRTLMRLRAADPGVIAAAKLSMLTQGAAEVAVVLQHAGHRTLIFDDIHLLDDTSLEVLAQLLSGKGELVPWCDFVLGYRPMRARRKVRALCERLALEGRLRLIQPAGLKRDAVLELLGDAEIGPHRLATADRLVELSGGTPGVLVELIDSQFPLDGAPGRMPPQIRSILLERLRACSSTAEGLAQLASVAGSSFSVGLATSIAGLSSWKVAEKWNELLLAGVFDARGFAFPLVEAAVREAIPDAVRQFMHGEVAKALERQGAADERLAFHWREAGDIARAARHARAAAAASLYSGDVNRAIATLEAAVFDVDRVDTSSEGRTITLLQLAALYLETDRLDRIAEVLDAAARSPASVVERGICTALGGRTLFAMKEYAAARAALTSALPLVENDQTTRHALARWIVLASSFVGDMPNSDGLIAALQIRPIPPEREWQADTASVHTPTDAARCLEMLRTRGLLSVA
jgi:DNA-binding SARP family transcriptional activator/tetratricopeptide (TPR) repeat protein